MQKLLHASKTCSQENKNSDAIVFSSMHTHQNYLKYEGNRIVINFNLIFYFGRLCKTFYAKIMFFDYL